MNKGLKITGGVFAGLLALGVIGSATGAKDEPNNAPAASESPSKSAEDIVSEGAAQTESDSTGPTPTPYVIETPEPTPDPTPEPEAHGTTSQEQAVRKADSYLEYQAFSQKGLIEQLEFEGFSHADSVYGVTHIDVDWKAQAAAKADSYLEYQAFSRSGLIEQLEFEGFTTAQAVYGVSQAGL